jgi:hypothetical protein
MKRALLTITFIFSITAVGSAQQFTYYFPQVAIGDGWMTTIFVTNAIAGTPGVATITFTQSDGTPFKGTWVDEMGNDLTKGGNTITVQLSGGETRKFMSTGDVPFTMGFATVYSNSSAVLGNAVITAFDGNGNIAAEAGAPMAVPLLRQALFVDTTKGVTMGLAVANPNDVTLHITFDLVGDSGRVVGSTTIDLGARQQMGIFLDELFPGLSPMIGRLQFSATNPMTSIAFRFNAQGVPFTTLSPIALN